jgi:hypothetical protein
MGPLMRWHASRRQSHFAKEQPANSNEYGARTIDGMTP